MWFDLHFKKFIPPAMCKTDWGRKLWEQGTSQATEVIQARDYGSKD